MQRTIGDLLTESRSTECDLCCAKPAHPVDSAPGRCRRRTEEEIRCTGLVGQSGWSEEELAHRHGSAADIATKQVRIHPLEDCRRRYMAGQNTIAKAWRKTLNLRLNARSHVHGGSIRDVAIGPERVLTQRSARWIKKRWLRRQHKGPLGMMSLHYRTLRIGDLIERAAEMNGDGAPALCRLPRDRLGKRIVNLEDSRSGFEPLHQHAEARRKAVVRDGNKLSWRSIKERQRIPPIPLMERPRVDAPRSLDLASDALQIPYERPGDGLRSAMWNGPANLVRCCPEHQGDCRAQCVVETKKGVRREPGKQGSDTGVREVMCRDTPRRLKRNQCRSVP